MPSGRRKAIPPDSLMQLRQRLDRLPHKSPERAAQIAAVAELYGLSATSVYRALRHFQQPHAARPEATGTRALLRSDRGAEVAHDQQAGPAFVHSARH